MEIFLLSYVYYVYRQPRQGRALFPPSARTRSPPSLSDADVVALNNLAAYYSYTNRVATGLGLRSEVPPAHAIGAAPR
jgi:uncharacterized protein YciW